MVTALKYSGMQPDDRDWLIIKRSGGGPLTNLGYAHMRKYTQGNQEEIEL